jgi:hypothetical protein
LKSIEDLEGLIDRIIPYAMTTTSIIQSTLVKRRPPPIGANGAVKVQAVAAAEDFRARRSTRAARRG